MNLDELRTVQTKERQKDSLQHLRDSFYEDVAEYLDDLKAERGRVADRADEPFSDPQVSRLTDEIETAENVIEAIYERRVGKVVKLSSFAAADMPVDEEGLTAEERDLFEDLVTRIQSNKDRVLEVIEGHERPGSVDRYADDSAAEAAGQVEPPDAPTGDAPPEEPVDPAAEDSATGSPSKEQPGSTASEGTDEATESDGGSVLAKAMGGEAAAGGAASGTMEALAETAAAVEEGDGDDSPTRPTVPPGDSPPGAHGTREAESQTGTGAAADDTDRTTVRITADVGEILGMDDREYDLAREDVVTLPRANAEALVEREAAERLE